MTLSDELTKLAARAKESETRAAEARTKARADLEQEVASARAAAQAQGEKLSKAAAEAQGVVSDWWVDAQKSWGERIDAVREDGRRRRCGGQGPAAPTGLVNVVDIGGAGAVRPTSMASARHRLTRAGADQ